jgi:hypothetical protein
LYLYVLDTTHRTSAPNQTPNHETSILKLLREEHHHLRGADSTAAGARRTRSFCVVPQRL